MTHILKTDSDVFQAVASGLKTWEIRRDDRGFNVGDMVQLRETKHSGDSMKQGWPLVYTGQFIHCVLGDVLHLL